LLLFIVFYLVRFIYISNKKTDAGFPPFRCCSSVAVSLLPFPYTVAVATAVAYLYALIGSSASMIGWPATERNSGKIELDPISTEERLRQLFSLYGCNNKHEHRPCQFT